jgi:hypothetical protein
MKKMAQGFGLAVLLAALVWVGLWVRDLHRRAALGVEAYAALSELAQKVHKGDKETLADAMIRAFGAPHPMGQ